MAILIIVCQSEGLLDSSRITKIGSHELLAQLSSHCDTCLVYKKLWEI